MRKKTGPVGRHRARGSSRRAFNNGHDLPQETDLAKSIRALHWRKADDGWRLYGLNRRCFGEVIPDSSIPGMWRTPYGTDGYLTMPTSHGRGRRCWRPRCVSWNGRPVSKLQRLP